MSQSGSYRVAPSFPRFCGRAFPEHRLSDRDFDSLWRARTQCRLRPPTLSFRPEQVIRECESPAEWRNLLSVRDHEREGTAFSRAMNGSCAVRLYAAPFQI